MDLPASHETDSIYSDSEMERQSLLSADSSTMSCHSTQDNDIDNHSESPLAAQSAKAIAMAEGDEWIPQTPSRPTTPATTASSDPRIMLDAGPAPPDYAQAIASRSFVRPPASDEESLYSTGSINSPQYLGKLSHWKKSVQRNWKSICLLNLGIYCALTTVILISRFRTTHNPSVELEIHPPDYAGNRVIQPEKFHKKTPHCLWDSYSNFSHLGWKDPKSFSLVETLSYSDFRDFGDVNIVGSVDIRPAAYGQLSPIEAVVSFATTSTWLAGIPYAMSLSSNGLRIDRFSFREHLQSQSDHKDLKRRAADEPACLSVWIGLYVKTELENFTLHTENLHVDSGWSPYYDRDRKALWSFRIRDRSHIYARKGNITLSFWNSRSANLSSQDGSLKLRSAVDENLNLETQNGEIEASIWQEPAHWSNHLTSRHPGTAANLTTFSGSGKQVLKVGQMLDDLWTHDLEYPYLLNSYHQSKSGSISLAYADEWEGKIFAESIRGSIDLSGEKLELLPNPLDGIAFGKDSKRARAQLGSMGSFTKVETQRGSITFRAGAYQISDSNAFWSR